ncbi:MarR family winged helix-turn-helix transcriptional regulator [Streptomyces caelestis]|uniref:MarR family winged helix-turn-helix transcriptional regulator n=1 Tax=Streptomyces caelestis TaxID=36816 RepID=UPI003662268C
MTSDALVRNTLQVTGVLTRIGTEHDLSLTQPRVLGVLRDRRPRMTELAAFLGLDKSALSGLVYRAERRDSVTGGKNPQDHRVVDSFGRPAQMTAAFPVVAVRKPWAGSASPWHARRCHRGRKGSGPRSRIPKSAPERLPRWPRNHSGA